MHGGTHLPDITVIAPVILDGETLAGLLHARRAATTPISAASRRAPCRPNSRTIEDEGVLIENFPLVEGGRLREAETRALFAWAATPPRNIDHNHRGPAKRRSRRASVACEELTRLVAHYGREGVAAYMGHVQDNAEEHIRRVIDGLEAGSFEVPMDNGAVIACARTRRITHARASVVDFTGTSPQQDTGNFNAPLAITRAAALYVFRTLVDDAHPAERRLPEADRHRRAGRLAC